MTVRSTLQEQTAEVGGQLRGGRTMLTDCMSRLTDWTGLDWKVGRERKVGSLSQRKSTRRQHTEFSSDMGLVDTDFFLDSLVSENPA